MTTNSREPSGFLDGLPHGPEFRFLDRVVSVVPGKSGVATYTVPADGYFLRGHFPGHPIMPGVLLVEALAQLGGVIAQRDPSHPPMADLRLAAIRTAKILGAAVPGDVLTVEATVTARLEGLVQVAGTISASGTPVLRAQVTLAGTLANLKS
ncbi:3-hydroxyacyl-ACP dehydratase FabZ [soil metagenome]